MAETGLFRHALLSPIQGLTDAALFLADLAGETPVDLDLVDEQRARILMEAEKVRRWKSIQRLYGGGLLGGEIRLQARRQPIRPVVEMCVERFRVTMQRRRISLSLEWDPRAPAHLSFDADALDIVLSNLLDNAAKYAFTSRPVTVGFHADRRGAWLWVQDIGHAVPDDVDVYAAGERMRWTDPFRSIHGEGLGLVIVRSLVIAHGGDVHHECRPENAHVPAARQETRPYVVRFTVMLPKEE
jgi:signal transduction histidine kinase